MCMNALLVTKFQQGPTKGAKFAAIDAATDDSTPDVDDETVGQVLQQHNLVVAQDEGNP
jgi:hypothetical protein